MIRLSALGHIQAFSCLSLLSGQVYSDHIEKSDSVLVSTRFYPFESTGYTRYTLITRT